MTKILVIDDERPIRKALKEVLEFEDYEVECAEDGMMALDMIENTSFDVILSDIKMPKIDGIDLLPKIFEKISDIPVIMMSAHGTIETAVEALKRGAYDYIEKPVDLHRLNTTIKKALEKSQLVTENKQLKKKINKNYDMVGDSTPLKQVKAIIEKVAPTEARVLITGENGTGKELVARWIHEKSNRNKMPFVEVNCAAIPSELIESELFGHEKGSFTSAYKQRKGKFEQADGGTLFLDEIGDMSLSAQAKVLRALQENKISRVGGDKEQKVDVRIISATNKDIEKEIKEGNFREDLYHRLSVLVIKVPPLKERLEDIPMLAEHFNGIICNDYGIQKKTITPEAVTELQKISWTGNIREFRNVIERLIILCETTITEEEVKLFAHPLGKYIN